MMPGSVSGRMTWMKVRDRPGAEIGRRLAIVRAELLQIGEDRQRQQHDEEMHEADDRGEPRVGELQRLGDQARARSARG